MMRVAVPVVFASFLAACLPKEDPPPKPWDATGEPYCGSDADCVELCLGDPGCLRGYCAATVDPWDGSALTFCTKPCTQDSECTSNASQTLACGVLADGTQGCVEACFGGQVPRGYACIDRVPTDCAVAPDTFCEACLCPTGQRCEPGVGCGPKFGLGQACGEGQDCESNNCSGSAGVCRVALGDPCTDQNCDLCLMATDGWSYCSTNACSGRCNDRGVCLDVGTARMCWPDCSGPTDTRCRGSCEEYRDSFDSLNPVKYFCDCRPGIGSCV
jgi:hypothetical protein